MFIEISFTMNNTYPNSVAPTTIKDETTQKKKK